MKTAKLKNGKILEFPDATPDSVIQAVVKRIMGVKEEPEIDKVIKELADAITDRETEDQYGSAMEDHSLVVAKMAKEIVDAISKINLVVKDTTPVITKQNGILEKQGGIFRDFIDLFKKTKVDDRDLIKHVMVELCKNIVGVTNNIEKLTLSMDKNAKMLVESQKENTKALYKLVEAYKSPKTIVRDKDGKAETINMN
jgi:hypothetical protein